MKWDQTSSSPWYEHDFEIVLIYVLYLRLFLQSQLQKRKPKLLRKVKSQTRWLWKLKNIYQNYHTAHEGAAQENTNCDSFLVMSEPAAAKQKKKSEKTGRSAVTLTLRQSWFSVSIMKDDWKLFLLLSEASAVKSKAKASTPKKGKHWQVVLG